MVFQDIRDIDSTPGLQLLFEILDVSEVEWTAELVDFDPYQFHRSPEFADRHIYVAVVNGSQRISLRSLRFVYQQQ